MSFNFHSDSGHGWLAVKFNMLVELKIESKISGFSYIRNGTVYLEEDCDMLSFIKAYEDKYKEKPEVIDLNHKYDRSPIRSFNHYRGVV